MKKLILFSAALLLLAACSQKADEQTADLNSDQENLRQASLKLIKSFGGDLKGELMSAFADSGSIHAIKVCSESAPHIAAKFSNESWSIKRVSDKNRNPENMASEREQKILSIFADSLESPGFFFDEWVKNDSSETYYFYKPVTVGQLCLKCHGGDDTIDENIKSTLTELYPDDNATGYSTGDLRGMFVVEVKWPEGKEYTQEILANDSL